MSLLTLDECAVLNHLVEAWNMFLSLETLHPWEQQEFQAAIHVAQHILMSRPVLRKAVEESR